MRIVTYSHLMKFKKVDVIYPNGTLVRYVNVYTYYDPLGDIVVLDTGVPCLDFDGYFVDLIKRYKLFEPGSFKFNERSFYE